MNRFLLSVLFVAVAWVGQAQNFQVFVALSGTQGEAVDVAVSAQSMGAAYAGSAQTDENGQAWIPLDINVSFFPQVTATLTFLDCDSNAVSMTSIDVVEDSTSAGTTSWIMPFSAEYCGDNPGGGGDPGGGGGTGGGGTGGDPCAAEFTLTQATTPLGGPEAWNVWAIVQEPDAFTTYFWDFGDGNSSDEPNPTHVYAEAGDYLLCLTTVNDSLGCTGVYCDTVSLDDNGFRQEILLNVLFDNGQVSSVLEALSPELSVYPNPARDVMHVEIAGLERVEWLDLTGRLLRSWRSMDDRVRLDVGDLPRGTYLVRCSGIHGTQVRRVGLN